MNSEQINAGLKTCHDLSLMMANTGHGLSRALSELAVGGWYNSLHMLKAALLRNEALEQAAACVVQNGSVEA